MDSSLHQAATSMGFSRQEYWSGLLFPSNYLAVFSTFINLNKLTLRVRVDDDLSKLTLH